MYIDSHCHLDYLEERGRDLDEVIRRAQDAGVGRMVTISTKISEFDKVRTIAERFENVWCSVGIHPHEAETEPEIAIEALVELAQHPKVVAIGETGLDYYYEHSPREEQKKSFLTHIAAARQSHLPLIVHTRDAEEDTIAIMRSEYEKAPYRGLIHCFSSTQKLCDKSMEIGMMISISGIATFKTAEALRAIIATVPLDHLLIETDAPFLAPTPWRGKMNEPAFVVKTAEKLAEIKGLSPDEIAHITTQNFYNLFTKILP